MPGTELPSLSIARYPLVLLPVGLLGALTAMAASRVLRGRAAFGIFALGIGAVALTGFAAILGRSSGGEGAGRETSRRRAARELVAEPSRGEAAGLADKVDAAVRRPGRFPTLSPPPKPGATRPS